MGPCSLDAADEGSSTVNAAAKWPDDVGPMTAMFPCQMLLHRHCTSHLPKADPGVKAWPATIFHWDKPVEAILGKLHVCVSQRQQNRPGLPQDFSAAGCLPATLVSSLHSNAPQG